MFGASALEIIALNVVLTIVSFSITVVFVVWGCPINPCPINPYWMWAGLQVALIMIGTLFVSVLDRKGLL